MEGPQTFAGICTENAWGDGRDDPLNTQFLVLQQAHQLSEQKEWNPVNLLGREKLETKLDVSHICSGFSTPENGLNDMDDLNKKLEDVYDYDNMEKLMIFAPKDSTLNLDEVMKLWLSTE